MCPLKLAILEGHTFIKSVMNSCFYLVKISMLEMGFSIGSPLYYIFVLAQCNWNKKGENKFVCLQNIIKLIHTKRWNTEQIKIDLSH